MAHSEQNTSKDKKTYPAEIAFTVLTGVILGYLIMSQAYSVDGINEIVERDRGTNVFREMRIVHEKNKELEGEINSLEATLDQYSHRASYLQAVDEEIKRYEVIAGLVPVKGPGVVMRVKSDKTIGEMLLVDLINEVLNGGAEAISVQDIRLVEESTGFDTLPNGQVFLNGSPLSSPYELKIIGPKKEILDALQQPGGVIERIKKQFPEADISFDAKEVIEMEKVL